MKLTGNIVWASEYAILSKMDRAYCAEMNIELENARLRHEEEQIKQQEENAKRGKKGKIG